MVGDILQPTHLLFVLVIALLVLGPKRLPEVGRALGRGLRDFKHALSSEEPHEPMITAESHQSAASEQITQPAAPTSEPAAPTSAEKPTVSMPTPNPGVGEAAAQPATALPSPEPTAPPPSPEPAPAPPPPEPAPAPPPEPAGSASSKSTL